MNVKNRARSTVGTRLARPASKFRYKGGLCVYLFDDGILPSTMIMNASWLYSDDGLIECKWSKGLSPISSGSRIEMRYETHPRCIDEWMTADREGEQDGFHESARCQQLEVNQCMPWQPCTDHTPTLSLATERLPKRRFTLMPLRINEHLASVTIRDRRPCPLGGK